MLKHVGGLNMCTDMCKDVRMDMRTDMCMAFCTTSTQDSAIRAAVADGTGRSNAGDEA